jgi:hypothetical protein
MAKRAAEELSSPETPKQTAKLLLALELPPTRTIPRRKNYGQKMRKE